MNEFKRKPIWDPTDPVQWEQYEEALAELHARRTEELLKKDDELLKCMEEMTNYRLQTSD